MTLENYNETFRVPYDDLVALYGTERVNREIDLELESKEIAKNRFLSSLSKRAAEGAIAEIGTTKDLLKEAIPVCAKAIEEFKMEADNGKAGRKHICVKLLRELDSYTISYLTIKCILSQTALFPLATLVGLCKQVGSVLEDEVRFNRLLTETSEHQQKTTKIGVSKRVGLTYKKMYMKATEEKIVESGELTPWVAWDNAQKVSVGLKLVEIFCYSTGLGRLQKLYKGEKWAYQFVLDNTISDYIRHNDQNLAELVFKYRPMVIPPKKWTTPLDGGYYIKLKRPALLVKSPAKIVKELYRDVDMPKVYEAVNAIQETKWHINKKVLDVANEILFWDAIPEGLEIPSRTPPEPPSRPPEADYNEEVSKAWRLSMVHYYQDLASSRGKRLLTDALVSEASVYKNDPEIYFPHNLDFRGRVYPMTTLSPQGNDLSKGLLEFANGVPLGEHGQTWLAMHGANCYGLDKKPLEERLAWVYGNFQLISSIANNPLDNLSWTEADSPWEFLEFCFEWTDMINSGEPRLYESHIAVAFDGSCSGIQHFSAMLKDEIGGVAVNLTPASEVHDIYKMVADKVIELLKEDLEHGSEDSFEKLENGNEFLKKGTSVMAKEWLAYGVTRKVTKRSVMTLAYGSKQYGFGEQVLTDTVYPALAKNPLAFSKPNQAAHYMASLIWKAVSQTVVKAVEAMEWLQVVSGLLATDRDIEGNPLPVTWITPAGFPVRQKYEKATLRQIRSVLSGSLSIYDPLTKDTEVLHKGDAIYPAIQVPVENSLDTRKQRQGIAPNFVHSMDASHLMLTVCSCYESGIKSFAMIHDSYGTHAGNADTLFRTVREVFVDTYKNNNILQDLHDHVANQLSPKTLKKLPDPPKSGNLDLDGVLESIYAFA